jgi:hypothetical protein
LRPPKLAGFFYEKAMMKSTGQNTQNTTIDVDKQPLFRVRKPLWYKADIIRPGSLHRLESLDKAALEKLTSKNTIAEVQAPPLSILPGWQVRSEKLAAVGIVDAVEFLGANASQVAAYMQCGRGTVERWKNEVLQWLTAPEQRG